MGDVRIYQDGGNGVRRPWDRGLLVVGGQNDGQQAGSPKKDQLFKKIRGLFLPCGPAGTCNHWAEEACDTKKTIQDCLNMRRWIIQPQKTGTQGQSRRHGGKPPFFQPCGDHKDPHRPTPAAKRERDEYAAG